MQQWMIEKGPALLGLLWYLHAFMLLRITMARPGPCRLLTDAEIRSANMNAVRFGYLVFVYSVVLYTLTYYLILCAP